MSIEKKIVIIVFVIFEIWLFAMGFIVGEYHQIMKDDQWNQEFYSQVHRYDGPVYVTQ